MLVKSSLDIKNVLLVKGFIFYSWWTWILHLKGLPTGRVNKPLLLAFVISFLFLRKHRSLRTFVVCKLEDLHKFGHVLKLKAPTLLMLEAYHTIIVNCYFYYYIHLVSSNWCRTATFKIQTMFKAVFDWPCVQKNPKYPFYSRTIPILE